MDLTRLPTNTVLAKAELLISDVVASGESKRAYRRAVRDLVDWCVRRQETDFDKEVIYRYRNYLISRSLAPATINQNLSAIRTLAIELGDNGTLSPTVAAAITRIRGVKSHGIRIGKWLGPTDAHRLLDAPDRTRLKGKRDCALLAIAFGCGLRRFEIAKLTVQTMQQRSGRWVLVDIRGKHDRIRSVPMASWAHTIVDEWLTAAGIGSGCVFRAINKTGRVHGNGLSGQAVYEIIKGYGVDIGVGIAPHDLRRSFARMAREGNSSLEQIQLSLGHASVATTERYVGARQNLVDAPCDRLGLSFFTDSSAPIEEDEFPSFSPTPGVVHMPATGFAYVDGGGQLRTIEIKAQQTHSASSECSSDQEERARQLKAALDSW
jgi:site-specific recombinase XerD